MGLTIRNRYSSRVYVAIGFSDDSCPDNTGPHIIGWWGIDPGGQALVYANDVNQYSPMWFYLAEAANGAVWNGPYVARVPDTAFNRCWRPEADGRPRGFRELFVGDNEDFTLNLVG
ncbi:DUF1036 domain-containing protein [Saccharothrix obliqua]|uniref:DUF1036 domain-containing protein n=1 Tax=Saccharothrix obliqua TaxID=2861747 RepID=UPI001C603312|nr:DUF1036 domain-containing protein [Saccharothrix obliqua]MBW4721329.1 DUF1036 domain-containing protein [Saccharothrix obliqua]